VKQHLTAATPLEAQYEAKRIGATWIRPVGDHLRTATHASRILLCGKISSIQINGTK
jgi:hypothetical protein